MARAGPSGLAGIAYGPHSEFCYPKKKKKKKKKKGKARWSYDKMLID